jgi:hypothetical protein
MKHASHGTAIRADRLRRDAVTGPPSLGRVLVVFFAAFSVPEHAFGVPVGVGAGLAGVEVWWWDPFGVPSLRFRVVQPGWSARRLSGPQARVSLSMSVDPPRAQPVRWCTWVQAAGTVQPGRVQPRSVA